ncbi:MAG: hypothetical protein ABMA14_27610 [Hyphomonadaceae bacterium]
MKAVLAGLAALFMCIAGIDPAAAQTRTVRHPETGGPAITVDLPGDWTTSIDPDNNLIIVGPGSTVAFSLSVVANTEDYSLDEFAREAMDTAAVQSVAADGEAMIPPFTGTTYIGQMPSNGQTVNLKMLIVKAPPDTILSATMITGDYTTVESTAVGEMILKTLRVVDYQD